MGKNYAMGQGTHRDMVITEKDPFINVFDDGTYNREIVFNTADEARAEVPPRWREGTKTMRVSELPPEELPKSA